MDELKLPVISIRPDGRLETVEEAAGSGQAPPPAPPVSAGGQEEAGTAEALPAGPALSGEEGGEARSQPAERPLRLPFLWEDGLNSWVSGLQKRWSEHRLQLFLEQSPYARRAELLVQVLGITHALARHQLWRALWPDQRQRKGIKRMLDRFQEIGIVSRWHWGLNGLESPNSHYVPVYVLGPSGRQILQLVRSSLRYQPGLVRDTRGVFRYLVANEIWSWLARDRRHRLKGWQTACEIAAGGESALVAARFRWQAGEDQVYYVLVDVLRGERDILQLPDRVQHFERHVREREGDEIPVLWLVAESREQALWAETLLWERGLGSEREDGMVRMWSDDAGLFCRQPPDRNLFAVFVEGDQLVDEPAELPGFTPDVDPSVVDQR